MIDPHLGQAAFRIGFYVAFASGILSLMTPPASPERAISNLTLLISIFFLLVVVVLVRVAHQKNIRRRDDQNPEE